MKKIITSFIIMFTLSFSLNAIVEVPERDDGVNIQIEVLAFQADVQYELNTISIDETKTDYKNLINEDLGVDNDFKITHTKLIYSYVYNFYSNRQLIYNEHTLKVNIRPLDYKIYVKLPVVSGNY